MSEEDKMMENREYNLHLKAGFQAGKGRTCGKKINYKSEDTARKAIFKISEKGKNRHVLEPYPCVFCGGWHIGRKMSQKELMTHDDVELPKEKINMLKWIL